MHEKPAKTAEDNPAVRRCCQAWDEAYDAAIEEDEEEATSKANFAYCAALPPLDGIRNLRNFVACVAYGCLIDAIDTDECSRLVYAAQVAHNMRRIRKPQAKNPSNKKIHPGAIKGPENATLEPFSVPV
jgi:hypothetical protein